MTETNEVYKCGICGNIVEVLHSGKGELVCCGRPMELLEEKAEEMLFEKHKPVVEIAGGKAKVKVGSVPHPMEKKHYIEWIEMVSGAGVCRKFLKPGEKPEADFLEVEKNGKARAYCNIHGLWKS